MPAEWEVKPGHKAMLPYGISYADYSEHEITFTPHNLTEGMYEFGIEIRVGECRIPRFVQMSTQCFQLTTVQLILAYMDSSWKFPLLLTRGNIH